jgi:outer membrane protein OmpA-like peptidoglycan-associated protein
MRIHRITAGALVGLFLASGGALAQQLDNRQIIQSLGQVQGVAPAIDLAVLVEDLNSHVGQGVGGLPNWSGLANLAQLAVEIDFENNSVAIEPKSYRTIGLIADALHHPRLLPYKFLIVGHSSATGDARHNLKLSAERAQAITEALTTTFAVSPDRLYAIGVGQEWPIDAQNPKSAVNRRVQLINLGKLK